MKSSTCTSRRLSFSSSSSPWFEKISLLRPCYSSSRGIQYCTNILGSLYGDCHELLALLQYPKHAMIGYLRVSIQNNPKNRSNYTVSYAQTCYRTKIKLTLAVTNRKCRRHWFKTSHNGEQNNPLGVAKKGGGSGN